MGIRFERYKLTHQLMASADRFSEYRREFVERLLTLSEEDAAKELEKLHTRFLDVAGTDVTLEDREKMYASYLNAYSEARKGRSEKPLP